MVKNVGSTDEIFSHAATWHMEAGVIQRKTFNFKTDVRIPVVLVCLVADLQFRIWDDSLVQKGKSLLVLRRGFDVGAMPGLWSMVAGVQDYASSVYSEQDLGVLSSLKEISEEVGFPISRIGAVTSIGHILQPNPDWIEQVFDIEVFCAEVTPGITPPVQLCYEHTGAVWIQFSSIAHYLEGKLTEEDRSLKQVVTDGVVPNFFPTLKLVKDYFQTGH